MKKYTFCCTHWHSTVTSITEEVLSFSLVNHCPQHINFVDRVQVVEVNTCEQGVETEKKGLSQSFITNIRHQILQVNLILKVVKRVIMLILEGTN